MEKRKKLLWRFKRVSVPSILQIENTECGAASLAMVMAYYKLFLPLEKLRLACGVSRDGMNALNLVQAARSFGFDARGFKMNIDGLRTLRLPLIIHWNFNHFLVLESRKGDTFYLNDPASGPRKVCLEEFNSSFTGLAIQLIPTAEFKPGGCRQTLVKALLSRMKNVKRAIFFIFLCGALLAVPGIVIPTMSELFVDKVLGPNPDWLPPLLLALALSALVKSYLIWLQRRGILELCMSFIISTSSKLFSHMIRLPTEFYQQRAPGVLQYCFQLNHQLAESISGQAGSVFSNIFMALFFLIVMFQYDVSLTITAMFIAGINIVTLRFVNMKRQVLNQTLIHEKSKLMAVTMGGIQLIETIKAMAMTQDYFAKWSGHQARSINAEQKMAFSTVTFSALPQLLSTLNNNIILLYGAWRVMQGDLTMGMLVAFQALASAFLQPVSTLTQIGAQIQEARGCVDKLNDVLNYEKDKDFTRIQNDKESSGSEFELDGELELKNVTFGYCQVAKPLIENFSIHIKPGQRIALVGRSGSGKSTVAKIAAGLYQPWSGEVLYDRQPRDAYPRRKIQNSLGVVDQEISMFSGTIRDNLSMWNPLKDEKDIIHAADDAEIHHDIANRGFGYGAQIIEGGRNFSGGQRQRLEIARALSGNPSILVLDEATSFLDPETEKRIDCNLRRRGCSCLIVAHRLSTIRDCDEIVVMERGKIVQRGVHADLIKDENGLYAKLIQTG